MQGGRFAGHAIGPALGERLPGTTRGITEDRPVRQRAAGEVVVISGPASSWATFFTVLAPNKDL